MSIEEAQRILQEAGWEVKPPKPAGVVTHPNDEDVYWFCYSDKLALESYTGSSVDETMLRHRRIFYDEASAQKRLEEDDHYVEVDRREIWPLLREIRDYLQARRAKNEEVPVRIIQDIIGTINYIEPFLTPPLPHPKGGEEG